MIILKKDRILLKVKVEKNPDDLFTYFLVLSPPSPSSHFYISYIIYNILSPSFPWPTSLDHPRWISTVRHFLARMFPIPLLCVPTNLILVPLLQQICSDSYIVPSIGNLYAFSILLLLSLIPKFILTFSIKRKIDHIFF